MILTNRLNLPEALVSAIANDSYSRGDSWRTVTELISPPRSVALKHSNENKITEDVAERLYSMYGQIVHGILERSNKTAVVEKRLFTEVLGKRISGQFDSLDVDSGTLRDWKFSTAWKAKQGEPPQEWVEQMNLLAHLLREHGHEVRALEIVLLMRDHSKLEAKRDASYPQLPVQRIPIALWKPEKAKEFLELRVKMHLGAEVSLPECSKEERWAKPDVFAVMKEGRKSAVKLYDNETEAQTHAYEIGGFVTYRPGESVRCSSYCAASSFCTQFQKLKGTPND